MPGLDLFLLDNACFLESLVGAVFSDGLHTLSREGESEGAVEFWHEHTLLLEVSVLTAFAAWGKFGSTNTVGVATAYNRAFAGYCADLCHKIAVRLMVS